MAVSVLNVLWQVFTRFVIRHPSSYTEELARYLLVWVGLLGAAYASGHKLHLAIDLFSQKMKPAAANCRRFSFNCASCFRGFCDDCGRNPVGEHYSDIESDFSRLAGQTGLCLSGFADQWLFDCPLCACAVV
jgi:hypothetical protein